MVDAPKPPQHSMHGAKKALFLLVACLLTASEAFAQFPPPPPQQAPSVPASFPQPSAPPQANQRHFNFVIDRKTPARDLLPKQPKLNRSAKSTARVGDGSETT